MQDFEILVKIIEEETGVTKEQLISKRRFRELVDLRTICSSIIKKHNPKISLERIGSLLNLDHSSVCHARNMHNYDMEEKHGHIKYIILYEKIYSVFLDRILSERDGVFESLFEKRNKLTKDLDEVNRAIKYMVEVRARRK